MAEKDQRPEYLTLAGNKRLQAIIRAVKRAGKLSVWSQECTKYNNPRPGEDGSVVESGPREDGHFDVEGHSAVDVSTGWRLRFWHPSDLRSIARGAVEWVGDTWDLYNFGYLAKRPRAILDALRWVRDTWPITTKMEGWTWTLNSLKTEYDEAAWDKAGEIVEQRRPLRDDTRAARETVEVYDEVRSGITREEVEAYLADNGMRRVSERMWVNAQDPTCFVYDEAFFPFDMKDGWSDAAVASIIGEWWAEMLGESVKTEHDSAR